MRHARALLTAPLVALALGATVPSTSVAAGIRECGSGPNGAYNVTTRVVSCREARRVIGAWGGGRRAVERVRGLTCRFNENGVQAQDIRCTGARGRVVRWQMGE